MEIKAVGDLEELVDRVQDYLLEGTDSDAKTLATMLSICLAGYLIESGIGRSNETFIAVGTIAKRTKLRENFEVVGVDANARPN